MIVTVVSSLSSLVFACEARVEGVEVVALLFVGLLTMAALLLAVSWAVPWSELALEADEVAAGAVCVTGAADDDAPDWLCAKATAGTRAINTTRLAPNFKRRDLDEL